MLLDSSFLAAETFLRSPPPKITEGEAERFLRKEYGIDGTARALGGERDRNFTVKGHDGRMAVLKFYNLLEDRDSIGMQHAALIHLAQARPGCAVPKLIPARNGALEVGYTCDAGAGIAALIDRLPGENPLTTDLSPQLRHSVGRVTSALSNALSDFAHPSACRTLLWDMMNLPAIRHLTELLPPSGPRAGIERWIDRFATQIRPSAARLPRQLIHNDLSLSNIMVDSTDASRVTGVIDFGDMVHAPRVNEFAVAASYFVAPTGDPETQLREFLAGAAHDCTLTTEERRLLPEMVRARLAVRILLAGWRAHLFPENRDYILRSTTAAQALWDRLAAVNALEMGERLGEGAGNGA